MIRNTLAIILIFVASIIVGAQKIKSIHVKTTKEKFGNHYKNYTTRDSIVLYINSTFRREENYWGFDEVDNRVLLGKWSQKRKSINLLVLKRDDSSKTEKIEPYEISLKLNYLRKNYKKLK